MKNNLHDTYTLTLCFQCSYYVNVTVSSGSKNKLQNIKEEDVPATWTCPPPETPTKSMEFLARSWSLSAMELSKALSHTDYAVRDAEKFPLFPLGGADSTSFMASSEAVRLALNCLQTRKVYFSFHYL